MGGGGGARRLPQVRWVSAAGGPAEPRRRDFGFIPSAEPPGRSSGGGGGGAQRGPAVGSAPERLLASAERFRGPSVPRSGGRQPRSQAEDDGLVD